MASNILSIGQSALAAAQAGINTTGHNIANAATPGFSRQTVIQGTASAQNFGFGFVGQGTQVTTITRNYSEFLVSQVRTSQNTKSGIDSYYNQIQQINNLLADSTSGLSPAVQTFFKGVQDVAADPNAATARQSLLSSADSLTSRFQGLSSQLNEIRQGVNGEITSSVNAINQYAKQIAALNDAIEKAQGGSDKQPANDLLDQRDQVVNDLNKEIKATVVSQNGSGYNVFIGNGQPLVLGNVTFGLTPSVSPTDLNKLGVSYVSGNGNNIPLAESNLTGGTLGGLFSFRSNTLDTAQNSLGRIAIGLASTFNAQHRLGQDQNGNAGTDFFNVPVPLVTRNVNNPSGAQISASIANPGVLTTSDYNLHYDGTNYTITRLSDNTSSVFATLPRTVDGVVFGLASGTPAAGDDFLIRPTANGASTLSVAITDKSAIAAAAPIRTAITPTNTGTGAISAGSVTAAYLAAPLGSALTLTYNSGAGTLTGFPGSQAVTVTNGGSSTVYAAGVPVPYTAGATISFGGISFTLSGAPANADTFSVGPNTSGAGDNRNAALLGALQTANTLDNNSTSYQGAYSQFVSSIGNKTRELQVTQSAEGLLLSQAQSSQQAISGVNLDEEATNLLRYQQAYQAAGKVMQTANKMFDILLSLNL